MYSEIKGLTGIFASARAALGLLGIILGILIFAVSNGRSEEMGCQAALAARATDKFPPLFVIIDEVYRLSGMDSAFEVKNWDRMDRDIAFKVAHKDSLPEFIEDYPNLTSPILTAFHRLVQFCYSAEPNGIEVNACDEHSSPWLPGSETIAACQIDQMLHAEPLTANVEKMRGLLATIWPPLAPLFPAGFSALGWLQIYGSKLTKEAGEAEQLLQAYEFLSHGQRAEGFYILAQGLERQEEYEAATRNLRKSVSEIEKFESDDHELKKEVVGSLARASKKRGKTFLEGLYTDWVALLFLLKSTKNTMVLTDPQMIRIASAILASGVLSTI